MDPEEYLEKIKEIIKGIAKAVENETIYSINIGAWPKRSLVNEVPVDSKYKKSFDDYLRRIADKLTEDLKKERKYTSEEITFQIVINEFCILQDMNDNFPKNSKILIEIDLIAKDYEKITKLVKENFN